jgi:16S rRNA (cytidine1402-2'-O)-methyltransferase
MGFGTLYVVATPLGNLEDITFRAVRVLKEAPVIACEDTRRTVKLLNRYEIRTPMVVFHEYNKPALPRYRTRDTTWCGTPSRRGFPWR